MNKNNFKIALVSMQQDAEKDPPVGLVCLATYLSDRVGLRNENIKVFDKNYYDVEKELINFKPDMLGITAMSVDYMKAINLARKIKSHYNIPIILGGVHISSLPESLKDCFDVGVLGEGEETLEELIEIYFKYGKLDNKYFKKIKGIVYLDNKKTVITGMRDLIELDTLPLLDLNFIHKDYFKKEEILGVSIVGIRGPLISSRGCPYRCEFCATTRFWRKMRLHSPEYTARVAEKLIKEHNVDFIYILDDLFSISPTRLREIKIEFEKRGILDKIHAMACTVRANIMTEELSEAMKELKIKIINFGFESGSERILKYLKAGSVSVEMNQKAVLLSVKKGFKVYGSLMYGSPSETIKDMKKTNNFIDFCAKNGASNIWSFVATPFPGTPFWDKALEMGTVSNDMDFSLLDHHISRRPLLLDKEISFEDFEEVFLEGKKKLRKLRAKLIIDFLRNNKMNTIKLISRDPRYYMKRVTKQLFKQ